jgi:hypothetical protein
MITTKCEVRGTISSVAFESGDRFVVGNWPTSPIGAIADVMWIAADGRRRLLVADTASAEFITSIYSFDDVCIAPLSVTSDGRTTSVDGHGLVLRLSGGRSRPLPFRRPLWFTALVEAPIARRLMGVEACGVSPTGVREWYQSRGWRWVESATGSLDGDDLGRSTQIATPLGVGFSDPPRRPSIVRVRVAIHPPADDA